MTARPAWHDRAACRKAPELYYDPEGEKPRQKAVRERQARRICEGCPVLLDCLADALERNERYGIRGGKTEEERREMRRRIQRRASRERGAA